MTLMQLGIVVLAVAGFVMLFGESILAWLRGVRVAPVVPTTDPAEASMGRVVALIRIARELEAVGAKSAAVKLKETLATVIEEDLLK
jgi:hypothetical protein